MQKQAQNIFEHLLTLNQAEQSTYISQVCADNPELKALVYQLVATHNDLATYDADKVGINLLDILADDTSLNTTTPNSAAPHFEPTLKDYEIIHKIGEGGMGDVYLGKPADKNLKNKVAIKLLRQQSTNDVFRQRFIQEQNILSQLKHPNISQFITAGYNHSDQPYVVMEYIEGKEIGSYCNEHRLNLNQRIELFMQLCSAIQYAHNNLILHRDIKPNNVLVTPDGSVKLLDFGIAKILHDRELITMTDHMAMTPAYASPEQISGKPLSIRSDVYSLGVLLYELLTGSRPFDLKSHSPAEYEKQILHKTPLKPSQKVLQNSSDNQSTGSTPFDAGSPPNKLSKLLANELDLVVMKAIHSDPNIRYDNVSQFSEDLNNYLNDLPIKAHKTSFAYRTKKFISRNKKAFIFSTLSIITVLSLLTFSFLQNIEINAQRITAVNERDKAETLSDAFLLSFKNADPTRSIGSKLSALDILDETQKLILNKNIADKSIRDELILGISQTYYNMGSYEQALNLLNGISPPDDDSDQAVPFHTLKINVLHWLDMRQELLNYIENLSSELLQNTEIQLAKAYAQIKLGKFDSALSSLNKIYAQAKSNDQLYLDICYALTLVLSKSKNREEAISIAKKCIADTDQLLSNDNHLVWMKSRLYKTIADAHGYLNQFDESTEMYEKAIEIRTSILGEDHFFVTDLYGGIASNLVYTGEIDEAIAMHTKALNGRIKHYGKGHSQTFKYLFNIANTYSRSGDYVNAEIKYQEVLELFNLEGEEKYQINVGLTFQGLAIAQDALNKPNAAISAFEHSIDIFTHKKMSTKFLNNACVSQVLLAQLHFSQNDYASTRQSIEAVSPCIDDLARLGLDKIYHELKTKLEDKSTFG